MDPAFTFLHWEECDDGVANGSAGSLCTLECLNATIELTIRASGVADMPIRQLFPHPNGGGFPALVASAGPVGTGCTFIGALSPDGAPPFQLHVTGGRPGTGAGVMWRDPSATDWELVCAEARAPEESTAHLYTGSRDPLTGEWSIEEVPYPLENTFGGQVFNYVPPTLDAQPIFLIDVRAGDPPTFVGTMWRPAEGTWLTTELGPVPNATRVGTTILRRDRDSPSSFISKDWIVHHFNDPPWVIVHEVRSDGDIRTVLELQLSYNVTASTATTFDIEQAGLLEQQLAVLREDGLIEIWSLDVMSLIARRFGQVTPGSRGIMTFDNAVHDSRPDVAVFEPNGDDMDLAVLINNGRNEPLRPQRFPLRRTCDGCLLFTHIMAFDRELLFFKLEQKQP
jgi:hypothetical protein